MSSARCSAAAGSTSRSTSTSTCSTSSPTNANAPTWPSAIPSGWPRCARPGSSGTPPCRPFRTPPASGWSTARRTCLRAGSDQVEPLAVAGELDHWRKSPDGALALTLLCDQFTRNIWRKTARAFSGDAKARETARLAVAGGYPLVYPVEMRTFFYMPFQHSESLADQEFCCSLFASTGNDAYV